MGKKTRKGEGGVAALREHLWEALRQTAGLRQIVKSRTAVQEAHIRGISKQSVECRLECSTIAFQFKPGVSNSNIETQASLVVSSD